MTTLSPDLDLEALFPPTDASQWQALLEKELKGLPLEKLYHQTYEELVLQPMYGPADLPTDAEVYPAQSLHRRGDLPAGYLQQPWLICQELPVADPQAWNQIAREELPQGLDALWLEQQSVLSPGGLDLVQSLPLALEGLPLHAFPLFIRTSAAPAQLWQDLKQVCQSQGLSPAQLQGGLFMAPLSDWALYGGLDAPWEAVLDEALRHVQCLAAEAPALKSLALDGRVWHRAGASASQELACLLAEALTYLRAAAARHLDPAQLLSHLHWTVEIGSDWLMELAKLRALRILWQRVLQVCGISGELWVHARTSTLTLSAVDPYTNMLRTTTQAFCAVLGGVRSLQTACFNEPLGFPDGFARRQARNLQLLLREENHLARLIDPVGGAWAIEAITSQLAARAWEIFQDLEKAGGLVQALRRGLPQSWIAEIRQQRAQDFAQRKQVLIGTSQYAPLHPETRLHLMGPWPVLEAKKPLAEMIPALSLFRAAAPFEALRRRVEALPQPPEILILPWGAFKTWKPRADFVQDFLQVAGLPTTLAPVQTEAEAAAHYWQQSSASAAVLCASDTLYPEVVPALKAACQRLGLEAPLLLAGRPLQQLDMLTACDVHHFIYLGADLPVCLNAILDTLGVPL